MVCHIDQSNKIENTAKDTVIALSNGVKRTVLIRAKDKRILQNQFRLRGEPRNFIIFTFSAMLAFLLEKARPAVSVIIDLEYKDSEKVIWDRLIEYSRKLNVDLSKSVIEFKSVGKRSSAHKLAARITAGKQNPDFRITTDQITKIIFYGKNKRSDIP